MSCEIQPSSSTTSHRRKWALLGNDILDKVQIIKVWRVCLLVDKDCHEFKNWDWMEGAEKCILDRKYLLANIPDNDELHEVCDETTRLIEPDYSNFM